MGCYFSSFQDVSMQFVVENLLQVSTNVKSQINLRQISQLLWTKAKPWMSGWPFRSKDPQLVLWSHFSKRWIFSGEGNTCCSVCIRLLLSWSLKSLFNRQESGEFLIPMFNTEVFILLLAFCSSPSTMEQDVDNNCIKKDALGVNKLWLSSLQCLVSAFKTMTILTWSFVSTLCN